MKGRDKRGREDKKKRKPKKQAVDLGAGGLPLRHHTVPVPSQPRPADGEVTPGS
ncbi:MAG: hypothetical protein ACREPI_13105 [Candidatus Dormibacterales bacterium]